MAVDAVRALGGVGYRHVDQLFGLLIEGAGLEDCPAERLERLVRFRGQLLAALGLLGGGAVLELR